jgi:hypothetical protein
MAMACFRLVTFFPLRPDFSLPCFIACISRLTSLPAEGEYLRPDDFFELDFFAAELRVLFLAELDFFLAAFLVAITILLGGQMTLLSRQVVS